MNFQKKILVIDGDQNLINTIKESLSFYNYDLCFANDGAADLQKALECNPDLILCDIIMEPVDGYQVYKVLIYSGLSNEIPFVFLKQNASIEDVRYGMNLSADDFLVKPVTIDELVIIPIQCIPLIPIQSIPLFRRKVYHLLKQNNKINQDCRKI